jgi:phage shock protein E
MNRIPFAFLGLLSLPVLAAEIPNRLIDYSSFEKHVGVVGELRAERRISEEEFLRMAAEPGTVVLDARSREKFDLLHVSGAKNLSLPDITAEELARIIPSKDTRILIYCNNNFVNEPRAFPTKAPAASLNIHTINVLFAYGYRNVFELGPLLDVRVTRIEFEGTDRPGA